MADRIAVMSKGVLQQYGSPDDLYNRPANLFVARFVGSVLINILPARYEPGERRGHGDADRARASRAVVAAGRRGRRPPAARVREPRSRWPSARSASGSWRPTRPRRRCGRKVALVEPLGARDVVHMRVGDDDVRATHVARRRARASATTSASRSIPTACTCSTTRPGWRCADGLRPPGGRHHLLRLQGRAERGLARRARRRVHGRPRAARRRQDDAPAHHRGAREARPPATCSSTTSASTTSGPAIATSRSSSRTSRSTRTRRSTTTSRFPLKQRKTPKGERPIAASARPPRCCASSPCSSASRASSRAASASAWPSAGRWCATRAPTSSTSRSRRSTPCCASRCARSSSACSAISGARSSTSRTTRSRR